MNVDRSKRVKKARDFEDKVVKTINSGAFEFDKGDAKNSEYLIEIKHTEKDGFRITKKILNKIWNEAFESNKKPKLMIGIEDEKEIWTLHIEMKRENKN